MHIDINFASREYMLTRKVFMILVLGILAGLSVFISSYSDYAGSRALSVQLAQQADRYESRLSQTDARLAALKKTVSQGEVDSAYSQAEFANMAIGMRVFSWTAFLNRLEEVVPDGVGISGIKPNFSSLDVDIAGSALGMKNITEFIDRLTKSPYFEDIPPIFHTSEVEADKYTGKSIQVFNLKIRYNPSAAGAASSGAEKDGGKEAASMNGPAEQAAAGAGKADAAGAGKAGVTNGGSVGKPAGAGAAGDLSGDGPEDEGLDEDEEYEDDEYEDDEE